MQKIVFYVECTYRKKTYGRDIAVFEYDHDWEITEKNIEDAWIEAESNVTDRKIKGPRAQANAMLKRMAETLECRWSWLQRTHSVRLKFALYGDSIQIL